MTLPPELLAHAKKRGETKLLEARAHLMRDMRFFGAQAMKLRLQAVENGALPHNGFIAVDGQTLFFVPERLIDYSDADLQFIWAHEIMHCAGLHMLRFGSREPMRWNVACDGAINGLLAEYGLKLPEGAVFNEAWKTKKGWLAAEEIYTRLTDKDVEKYAGGAEMGIVMPFAGGASREANGSQDRTVQAEVLRGEWLKAAADAKALAARDKKAGKDAGIMGGFLAGAAVAQVPWQTVLAEFVSRSASDYSWARPDRRFWPDVFCPAIIAEDKLTLACGIDTSGSVSGGQLSAFMAEMRAILESYPGVQMHAFFHDTRVYKTLVFDAHNPPQVVEASRGGTDFRPAFARIADMDVPPDAILMLTDLEGPMPAEEPDQPLLWITVGSTEAKYGRVVRMEGVE